MRLPEIVASLFLAAAFIGACCAPAPAQVKNTDASPSSPKAEKGSAACASCHSEIYTSYKKTVMAGASGAAGDALITGEFSHKPSGVRYQVYQREGKAWMSYERPGPSGLRGERELLYFIGSGVKGRTYLFSDDDFLFEAPINWYSQERRWNMTPGYTESREIPMNLPALVDCLNCHSSGSQLPVAGTDNKFSGKPFAHDGITCQRCHGAGEGHGLDKDESKGEGKTTIVNPAKLPPERRDAICMECHFEGAVAVEQPGKHTAQFQPGENLSDYIHYFLLSGTEPQKPQALSQFEALSQSLCKIKSGDRMWCGSCHDPHEEPENRAAYYRGKCLACHEEKFAASHHPEKPDCVGCHMPALPSRDVAHTEATDHRIRINPTAAPLPRLEVRGTPGAPLVAFPESAAQLATTRDFALAWETLALRNVENAPRRAEGYLRKAVVERPEDPVLLAALGFVEQAKGREKEARELYEHALMLDPAANDAAANLGVMEAKSGNLQRAVELWQGAFARVPYRSAIGMDLAVVFCAAGKRDEARKYVERVLEFNPDYGKAKSLLEHLKGETGECKP